MIALLQLACLSLFALAVLVGRRLISRMEA